MFQPTFLIGCMGRRNPDHVIMISATREVLSLWSGLVIASELLIGELPILQGPNSLYRFCKRNKDVDAVVRLRNTDLERGRQLLTICVRPCSLPIDIYHMRTNDRSPPDSGQSTILQFLGSSAPSSEEFGLRSVQFLFFLANGP